MPSYLLIVRAHLRFPLDARHPPRATSPLFSLRHYLATSLLQIAPVSPKPFRMNTCKNAPKPASLTTFRINTCKSVSKQRTLTTFRMNTYEKHRGVGLLWLTRHPVKDVCPVCPELLGERRSGARDLSRPARARRDKFRGAATRRLTRKRPEGSAADEAGGEDVSS